MEMEIQLSPTQYIATLHHSFTQYTLALAARRSVARYTQ